MDEQQALNAPYSIEWQGRTIKFSGITQAVKAACVSAAKLNAYEEAAEFANERWPGNEVQAIAKRNEYMGKVEDNLTTGRYKWGGELQEKWRNSSDGYATMLLAMTQEAGTPLNREQLEQMGKEMPDKIAAIIVLVMWDANNPKAKRPALIQKLATSLNQPTCTQG